MKHRSGSPVLIVWALFVTILFLCMVYKVFEIPSIEIDVQFDNNDKYDEQDPRSTLEDWQLEKPIAPELNPPNPGWWCDKPDVSKIPDPAYEWRREDPVKYKGYQHPAWPVTRTRWLHAYLNLDDYVKMDFQECASRHSKWNDWKSHTKTFIVMMSSPSLMGEMNRHGARSTWMTYLDNHPDIKVVFTLARSQNSTMQSRLEQEQSVHCDIIQFNFMDEFYNISLKTAFEFHYLYLTEWDGNRGPPDFFYLTQDDAYINVPKLAEVQPEISKDIKWKSSIDSVNEECQSGPPSVYGPRLQLNKLDGRVLHGDARDKYLIPQYLFAGEQMPPLVLGHGAFYPRGTLACLVTYSWYFPLHPSGDQWTALLFKGCGITITNLDDHSMFGDTYNPNFVHIHMGTIETNEHIEKKRHFWHSKLLEHYKMVEKIQ